MMEYPSKQAKGYLSPLWADFRRQKKAKWKSSRTIHLSATFMVVPFVVIVHLLITIPAVAIIHPLRWGDAEMSVKASRGPSDPFLYSQTLLIWGHFNTYTPIHQYTPLHNIHLYSYTGPLQHSILYTVMKWTLLHWQEEESRFWIIA